MSSPRCPAPVFPNSEAGWLGRPPTDDEVEIVDWLKHHPLPQAILHVGVGNALLFKEFGDRVRQGLSKDGAEVEHARRIGLEVLLCNKYDVRSYREHLSKPFDCVVDPNIRSYTCCAAHFRDYMDTMLDALTPKGVLLTSTRGLAYLVPTSLPELRAMCPRWSVRAHGSVVIMRPRLLTRLIRWSQLKFGVPVNAEAKPHDGSP